MGAKLATQPQENLFGPAVTGRLHHNALVRVQSGGLIYHPVIYFSCGHIETSAVLISPIAVKNPHCQPIILLMPLFQNASLSFLYFVSAPNTKFTLICLLSTLSVSACTQLRQLTEPSRKLFYAMQNNAMRKICQSSWYQYTVRSSACQSPTLSFRRLESERIRTTNMAVTVKVFLDFTLHQHRD